jgi:hypothetical protein
MPSPKIATTMPASDGPTIRAALAMDELSAMAVGRSTDQNLVNNTGIWLAKLTKARRAAEPVKR